MIGRPLGHTVKRILLISYYFPPSGGAAVQRVLKFARYLPDYGWLPTVLTVDPDYAAFPSIDASLLSEIPSEVEVIRTKAWDPFTFYSQLQGKKREEVIKVGYIDGDTRLKRVARWLRGNVFLPDARIGWVPFASRTARGLLKGMRFDAIMSTGPPHSCHLVGIAARNISDCPWVVDMRDPWVEIYYRDQMYEGLVARKIQTHLEKKVLGTADAVISVSNYFGERLQRRAPIRYYETIPNGFDPLEVVKGSVSPRDRTPLIIAYVGTYNLRRHSDSFVHALKKLRKLIPVEIHLVGKIDQDAIEEFHRHEIPLKVVEFLSHSEAVAYMNSVDVLLLSQPYVLSKDYLGHVSAKVFEYISARRPILALGPVDGDLADLLDETRAGEIFDHQDVDGILAFLKGCIESRGKPREINEVAIAKYERRRLTGRLANLLDRLSTSEP